MQVSFAVLLFMVTLVFAVLQSGLFKRTILSNAALFTLLGFVAGSVFGWTEMQPDHPMATAAIEIALLSILFIDGMNIQFHELDENRHLPSRALLIGMPLTFFFIALAAHFLCGLNWLEALLIAAILSPTDPVLASDIIHREEVPARIRIPLNIESGLNDGLALPVVVIVFQFIKGDHVDLLVLLGEVIGGMVIGIALPWAIERLARSRFFTIEPFYQPLYILSLGALVASLAVFVGANPFLAIFCAGLTISAIKVEGQAAFRGFAEIISELLKLASLFIFGSFLSPDLFLSASITAYLFALIVLLLARPVAIFLTFIGTPLTPMEKITFGWFGPKGFSSILYLLFVWNAYLPHTSALFTLVSITLVISIFAHSSTSLLFARWFQRHPQAEALPQAVAEE